MLTVLAAMAMAMLLATTGCRGEQLAIGDGRTLFLRCAGAGTPAVVLEAGWAADHLVWAKVQADLAQATRTCSYDRAGTGQSPPGPLPRTPQAVAEDLLRALAAARIDDELILVGHSIGAVYAQVTERLAGGRVVGLVLVDPTVEAMAPDGLAPFIADATACQMAVSSGEPLPIEGRMTRCRVRPTEEAVATWSHRVSELEHLFQPKSASVRDAMPSQARVEVLSAGQGSETPGGAWRIAQQAALARTYARGHHRVVPASGHMMMRDAPAAIVEATTAIILSARQRKPKPEVSGTLATRQAEP
ncbi:alpha/beta fold hydrolase [Thermaurantiacus sp.]